jgi:universal stress protein E
MVKPTCFQHILLADDGSEHAHAAIQLIQELPLPSNTHITVLRAFSTQQSNDALAYEEAVKETCTLLQNKGLQADPELLHGHPAEKIIEYADQHHTDLIVLGAKGLRATLGILLGGVVQQVIEYASCPVLVVRASMKKLQRILLVVDGSPGSEQAVKCLTQFPFPVQADLHIMHVLPPEYLPLVAEMSYGYPIAQTPIVTEEVAHQRAIEEQDGQQLLVHMADILAANQIKVKTVLKHGDAATEIIEYVKQNQVDLIVAGSRGLSRVRSWLLGSVSRKLVHYSGCSVLIVRDQE